MGREHRAMDRLVAGAAAQVPGERLAHALERGLARGLDEAVRGEDHARRADAALGAHLAHHRALEGMLARQALDRRHLGALRLGARHETRDDRLAVHEHGARATLALATALLGAGQPAVLAQHVEQALERVRVQRARRAVQRELHALSPFRPGASRGDAASTSGVAGIERTSRPAWRSAFTTAGAGPSMGSSPTPLAPNGPPAKWFSSMTMSMGGVSSVVGMT